MNRRLKKSVKLVLSLLILIFFVIFLIWFLNNRNFSFNNKPVETNEKDKDEVETNDKNKDEIEEPKTYLNNITYSVSIDKEVEEKIIEYMDLYYKSMKELKEYDMTYLFSNEEQANINQTAVSLLVGIRKLKPNDLTLKSALYDLDVKSVKKNGDTVNVIVNENNYLRFNFMSDIESKVYNIENDFTFKKIDGEYKIVKYSKVQDFYVMVTGKYNGGGKTALDKIKNDYLSLVTKKEEELKKDYQDYLENKGYTPRTCDHEYNREKAYSYAINWVNKRNSEWTKYDSNCQNYVSQTIYNGGVPMDYYGSVNLQWKNYDGSYNESETAKGLVYTWTYVPYFYDYVKNNKGYGLCGSVGVNMYYAEAGDVIHVGVSGPTKHALIVIGNIKKDGKTIDVLVNSNTVDLENYPISAYVYPYASLIKINGWNE